MARILAFVGAWVSVILLSLIWLQISPNKPLAAGTTTSATSSSMDASMPGMNPGTATEALTKDPSAPPYTLRDPAAAKPRAGTVHDITLTVEEKEMTVAPGIVQKVWAFGGTVPGPVIRVRIGDTVRIHLVNPKTNTMPHSIDFHASLVAWNDEMTDINPGQEKLYQFKAQYAGVFMYHCGTAGALGHMINGMYGMIIVEPRGGLPKVDQEIFLVQSEWYLGAQHQLADPNKAAGSVPVPDYVVFNGIPNQYKEHPIKVATGKTVRVFVLDAGPTQDSSFHIVGTIFDQVTKEGIELKRGNAGGWGSQAVDLAPAQGAIVEFRFAEDGVYPFLTHAFNFVGLGAIGLFQAGDGDPKN
jgi:nitrite reductase (NO-forming)